MPGPEPFKRCPLCGFVWVDLGAFMTDETLCVEGYQSCPVAPEYGVILVTHAIDGCHTTLGVQAGALRQLYVGPFWRERQTGLEPCRLLCFDPTNLEECDAECDMAWIRHVLQWLRRHQLPPRLADAGP